MKRTIHYKKPPAVFFLLLALAVMGCNDLLEEGGGGFTHDAGEELVAGSVVRAGRKYKDDQSRLAAAYDSQVASDGDGNFTVLWKSHESS